jgi:membrane-bound ClpP family serine protease
VSWTNWACLGLVIVGVVLFLVGANYYEATVGWTGVFLVIGGVLALLILYIYAELTKKK